MKTLAKITLLIITALLISLNVIASGIEFEQEQYIDDIPFNLSEIEAQTRYDSAVIVDYTFEEEGTIDDLPMSEQQLASLRLQTVALSQQFDLEEESYIDDIPCSILGATEESHNCFYAKAK